MTESQTSPAPSQLGYWDAASTVRHYARQEPLYTAEMRLLGLYKDRWSQTDMLDIGVGGGRTSQYFAELTRRYVGMDFAPNMVQACRTRYGNRWPHASFSVGDVTNLSGCQDAEFDLVLFSFNSIDCMPVESRMKALAEMKRVCRPGGWVAFSSHNIYNIPRINEFRFTLHPRHIVDEVKRWTAVRKKNMPMAEAMGHDAYVRYFDATIGSHYLIFSRPERQVEALRELGFKEVRMFSIRDGSELTAEQARQPEQSWIYYFCAK